MIPDKDDAHVAADFLEEHQMFPEVVRFLRNLPLLTGATVAGRAVLLERHEGDNPPRVNHAYQVGLLVQQEQARIADQLGSDVPTSDFVPGGEFF